jgi:hypothetical protein
VAGQAYFVPCISAPVTISGLSPATSITLNAVGGIGIDKNVDGNFFPSLSVQNGDQVRAFVISAGTAATASDCVVTAIPSGVTDTFTATTGTPLPPGPPITGFLGYNLWSPNYYSAAFPFIDIAKNSGIYIPGGTNPLAPGATSSAVGLFFDMPAGYGFIPPGNYVATTADGSTFEILGTTNVSAIVNAPGRSTFTVNNLGSGGDYSATYLQGRWRNPTGSPISISQMPKIFKASSEAAFLGGEIFDPIWLADLAEAAHLRAMDWTGTNNSGVTQASQLPAESDWTYTSSRGIPYTLLGKLGLKTGKKMWVCFPQCSDQFIAQFNPAADTVTTARRGDLVVLSHGFSNNDAVYFMGDSQTLPSGLVYNHRYYVKNATATTFQLSQTPGGATIDIPNNPGQYPLITRLIDPQSLFNTIAAQLFATHPSGQFTVEYSNETWNWGPFNAYHYLRNVIAPFAASTGDVGAAYAYMSMKVLKAMLNAGFARSQVTLAACGQAAQFAALEPMFDYVDPGIVSPGTAFKNIMDAYCIAPYFHLGSYPPKQMWELLVDGAASQPDSYFTNLFNSGIAESKGWTQTSITAAHAKRPGLPVITYECGHEVFFQDGSAANVQAVMARFIQYLDSGAGAAIYQNYKAQCFDATGLGTFLTYTGAGGYSKVNNQSAWGTKRAPHDNDTPRSTAIKAF